MVSGPRRAVQTSWQIGLKMRRFGSEAQILPMRSWVSGFDSREPAGGCRWCAVVAVVVVGALDGGVVDGAVHRLHT